MTPEALRENKCCLSQSETRFFRHDVFAHFPTPLKPSGGDLASDGPVVFIKCNFSESGKRSRILAEQDVRPVAKSWRGGSQCSCHGSPGRTSPGTPSGRPPVD